jgi:hypothetical protein
LKAAILDGSVKENRIAGTLKSLVENTGGEVSCFKLEEMQILPCRSCGSCGTRTPGLCVIEDQMQEVLPAIAHCQLLVFISSVTFGGYSYQLKKAVDRLMVLGYPLYVVKGGHLLHPMRYGRKCLLGIGQINPGRTAEEENFRLLVARNAMNMQDTCQTLILDPKSDAAALESELGGILGQVKL